MQKVAIVTLYKDNFGSILQAYSTYHYLSTLGYHCDLLKQKWENSFFDKISRLPKLIFKSIRYKDFLKDYLKSKKSSTEDLNLLSTKTKELMNEFVNSNFTITIVDSDHPEKVKDNYDFFITGSDQVWNGYDRFKFLHANIFPSYIKSYQHEHKQKTNVVSHTKPAFADIRSFPMDFQSSRHRRYGNIICCFCKHHK